MELWVATFLMFASLSHEDVDGKDIAGLSLVAPDGTETPTTFADLENKKDKGLYTLHFQAHGEAVRIPVCGSRGKVTVDGVVKDAGTSKGPLVIRASGDVKVEITASAYEKRIACSEPPREGKVVTRREGISLLTFPSPHAHADAGTAVVFIPKGHDLSKPGALLVGVHPWNGGPWTYAAYRELIEEAQAKDVVCVMPSGLGNSLYVADAEDEVLEAIDAVERVVPVDRQRVSLWGASMGGAGATTISFHHPDMFAFAASYFGDSQYDLTTYVRGVLGGEAGAHKVNALDILENARHLPVFLVHGDVDKSSPVRQSILLNDAMKKAGFSVEFERVPDMGHEGPLVARYLRKVVDRAATEKAPVYPTRVSYRSVRSQDVSAYGVTLARRADGDAFVDIERKDGRVHVIRAENVSEIVLRTGALGGSKSDPVDANGTKVRWQ